MGRQAGLTLIEIVFVIGVLGVLATLGLRNFEFAGKGLSEQLAARDAIIAELRRARAEALHRLPPLSGPVAVTADLTGAVSNQWTVEPDEVAFSYDRNGSVESPQPPVEITIDGGGNTLRACLPSANGPVTEGACP
ncbi:prepilin-type N-terminal cleavage/methylation domain-containing protein [Spiribacter roseus]|uniref:prepilin-type N-terminal cleavage/methylation domain-containing protein n=1 Tax=Spiribacter roseus TaxID=1855875 RepID=UPI0013308B70|nr:prepilin-type N-terminal cleavage/methylation domain-containing protein [Spiribacter roseus]KAF0282940.1 hypothetical protein BA898_05425 [Spiribacter roseus]